MLSLPRHWNKSVIEFKDDGVGLDGKEDWSRFLDLLLSNFVDMDHFVDLAWPF